MKRPWPELVLAIVPLGQHHKSPFLLLGFGRGFNQIWTVNRTRFVAPIDHPFKCAHSYISVYVVNIHAEFQGVRCSVWAAVTSHRLQVLREALMLLSICHAQSLAAMNRVTEQLSWLTVEILMSCTISWMNSLIENLNLLDLIVLLFNRQHVSIRRGTIRGGP